MKKILYLAFRFPIPATDGYRMRVYNYCKMLKEIGYEVDLFFIDSKNGYDTYTSNKAEAKELFKKVYYHKHGNKQKILSGIKSIIRNQSLQQNYYIDEKAKKRIEELHEKNKYDKVISSYIRMFEYIKDLKGVEKIIDYTDSIAYNYSESKEKAKGIWKYIFQYEYPRVKRYEKFILENVDKAFITSPEDKNFILDGESTEKLFEVFPQGISEDVLNYSTNKKVENIISFIGQMSYYPNVDAVVYFCDEILPKLNFNGTFYIVGKNPSKKVLELEEKYENVKVTGFVEDPYDILSRSKIIVAPMRLGGGIQNKILEGMALGKTVVAFDKVVKPIVGCESEKHIISCLDTQDFIDKMQKTLDFSEDKLEEIGKNAKKLIEERYRWRSIKKNFADFLEK